MKGDASLNPKDIYVEIDTLILRTSADRSIAHSYRTGFICGLVEAKFAVQRLVGRAESAHGNDE